MSRRHIHDAVITSYEVRSKLREIELHIEFSHPDIGTEYSLIVFQGVEGYHLHSDSFGSIILDIETVPAACILKDFGAEIAESYYWSGAFGAWAAKLETAADLLEKRNVHGFLISSSIGLSGWILASTMTVLPA